MNCGECGEEDCAPEFLGCCLKWVCDDCMDKHDLGWRIEEE